MSTHRCALAGALLLGHAGVVCAQSDPLAATTGAVEVIVVTAQKRSQSAQDVPIAISALTAAAMEKAGINDIFDVARHVPGLQVQQNTNPLNTQFRIRGIGGFGNIPNFEPEVAYYSDGAFRSRSGLGIGDLVDIQRIEILKGPQSTLYGKNSTAGVVAVYTEEPGDRLKLSGEMSVGNVKAASDALTWQAKASLSGPASESVGFGLSATYFDQGFLLDNAWTGGGINDMKRHALRGQLVLMPADALKLRLIVGHSAIPGSAGGGEPDLFYGRTPAALNAAFGVPCANNHPTDRIVCRNYAGEVSLESNEATLIATYDLANGFELTSTTSWDQYRVTKVLDADQLDVAVLDFNDRQTGDSVQEEVRITSPTGGRLDWLAGAFYYDNSFKRGGWAGHSTFVLGPQAPMLSIAPGLQAGQQDNAGTLLSSNDTRYFAVFGQVTWHLTERFEINASVRWQTESKDTVVTHSLNHTTPTLISIALLPASVDADLSHTVDAVTWTVTPQLSFTDDTMGYATASHGFKSGGFNGDWGRATPAQRAFKDEEVDNYELGVKSRFAQGRIQLNAAAFYSDFTNYQEAGFIALQFLVTNAEGVSARGIELDLTALLTDTLTAELNATYAQTKYDTYTAGSCYPGRVPDNTVTGSCNLSGQPLTNAPELKTHAALQYEVPVSIGAFYARADWTWTDEYFTNSNHDPRQVQSGFGLIDARVGVRVGALDVALWGNNLTDETYTTQSAVSNLFANDPAYQSFLAPGLSYGVTIRYRL
jgi:outer membrane receptor protein involved in Fe transport